MSCSSDIPVPFTLAGMQRGALRSIPFAPGIFVYGMAFGVLAREAGLSAWQAAGMSAAVYSGSAQMAALQTTAAGAGILAVVATILVINARYFLYGAALQPWFSQARSRHSYISLLVMVDVSWIVAMKVREEGENDVAFMFGAGLLTLVPWVVGSYLGSALGVLIANPAMLGLDFFLVAFSASMGAGMVRHRSDFWTIAVAALTAIAGHYLLPTGWTSVAAGIAGALTAYVRYDDKH